MPIASQNDKRSRELRAALAWSTATSSAALALFGCYIGLGASSEVVFILMLSVVTFTMIENLLLFVYYSKHYTQTEPNGTTEPPARQR